MENLLIHIGYHKTATTWFQTQLFTSASSVFVPVSRDRDHQSTVAADFFRGRDGYLLSPFDDNREVIISGLRELGMSDEPPDGKVPVISHERLSGNPHAGGFDASVIARRLAKAFPHARVFIVIREQARAILSSYMQYLKGGGTRSLESYLNTGYDGKLPGFSPHHFDYHRLVAEYVQLFGNDRVRVLPYEMFVREPGVFFSLLGEFVGRPLDVGTMSVANRIHESERTYLSYRLRWLNRFVKHSSLNAYSSPDCPRLGRAIERSRNRLAQLLPRRLEETLRHRLENEVIDWMGDRYAPGNQKLADLTGLDLGLYGYRL